ncbi:TspO/MBR family protein [Pseudophaeobacter profundi]|uniref:TspO/MBR family protein n=1 Tax=Pseudophaeobacter profundi TaxID=3034152 RepID=UPI00242E9CB0|nr:TspO/MBR family protein [Pseudophaeobacter profundi]
MKIFSSFLLFLIVVMGVGIGIGMLTSPGDWYRDLQKPFFNPPNWVFGPVWTVMYLIIAYVGWRVWQHENRAYPRRLWIVQMGLNFLWSPVFFAAEKPALALAVILCLLLTIVAFIRAAWHSDRLSALLFVPYVAWVGFALALNAAIVYLN